ncbi:hypothetical protein LSPH24S_04777 [Lysinibacillus sphaericus]
MTFHKNEAPEIDKVQKLLEEQPKYWERGHFFSLPIKRIDKIVDSYFPLVYKIEATILNALEDELTYQSNVNAMQIVFEFRSDLLHLNGAPFYQCATYSYRILIILIAFA